MLRVNLQEAKTQFSRDLDQVEKGDVIVVCRHNKPVAEIRPIPAQSRPGPRRGTTERASAPGLRDRAFLSHAGAADLLNPSPFSTGLTYLPPFGRLNS